MAVVVVVVVVHDEAREDMRCHGRHAPVVGGTGISAILT